MKKATPAFLFVFLVTTVFYFGCTKGDTGATGAPGPAGTANVMYSSWNALNMPFNNSDSAYEQTIKADSITQAVLDSGIVLTYMKYTDPSTQQTSVVNADSYMQEIYSVGNIALYSSVDYSGFYYRYIILHGGVKAGRIASGSLQEYTKAQLKAMGYEQVMKLLGRTDY